ncbi:MAG: TlpA family protein disulfide reductase [Ideonella sp.]|nr:TlpA family protein disulfide reductase [Ideonella sp.]
MRRAVVLLLAFGAVVASPAFGKTPGEVEIGQLLPEAQMQGLNGKSRKLSEFRGRPLIINVWASWCGPCRAESASLERLAWGDAAKHISIIGISTDDHLTAAQSWLKASNASLSHFIDRNLELENILGANRLPLTVLVDAKGRVVDKVYGAKAWDGPDALRLISQALPALKAGAAR